MDDEQIHVSVKNEIDEQLQERLGKAANGGLGFALDVAKVVEGDKAFDAAKAEKKEAGDVASHGS